jgi:O-methyltransferase
LKYGEIPSGHVIVPWLSDQPFLDAYSIASGRTLLHTGKCYMLHSLVRHLSSVPGDVAECGVYKGGSAYIISKILNGRKLLHLFDTFTGLPPGDPAKDNRYIHGGEFSETSVVEVGKFLAPLKDIYIHQGLIPGSLGDVSGRIFSLVHIDLDIYRPILESLKFFYPRIPRAGVIVLDDYGSEECRGAYLAVEEFCESIGTRPLVLQTGQAMIIKT